MNTTHGGQITRVSLLASSFSGSTLLGIMLCQDRRFTGFGDTYLIPGINSEEDLCNCGDSLAACKFRRNLAHGLETRNLPSGMIMNSRYRIPNPLISSRFEGTRFLPAYQNFGKVLGYQNIYSKFLTRESGFLDSIAELGGFQYFLDGCKSLVRADVFSNTSKQTQIIHLIRDPFAVIHSAATRHDSRGKTAQFNLRSWINYNSSARELCKTFADRSATILFDDLVNKPELVLESLSEKLGWGVLNVRPDNLTPATTHLLGNRSRHNATKVRSKQLTPSHQDLKTLGVDNNEIEELVNFYDKLKLSCNDVLG